MLYTLIRILVLFDSMTFPLDGSSSLVKVNVAGFNCGATALILVRTRRYESIWTRRYDQLSDLSTLVPGTITMVRIKLTFSIYICDRKLMHDDVVDCGHPSSNQRFSP